MEMSIRKDVNIAIPFLPFIEASFSRTISSAYARDHGLARGAPCPDIDPHPFIWNESEHPTPGVLH
jgi:hypothetical protein